MLIYVMDKAAVKLGG